MAMQAADLAELKIKDLYKRYLVQLEGLYEEHDNMMERLEEALPENLLWICDILDKFDPNGRELIRKQILDAGNDCIRNMRTVLEGLEISVHHRRR